MLLPCAQGNDVREFSSYPPGLDDVPRLLEQHHDVIIIDLDSDPGVRAGTGGEHRRQRQRRR